MAVRELLLLGNPQLYEVSTPWEKSELECINTVIQDLHDTLMDFRKKHGVGRAIAAPQIGIMKRLIYMYIERPVVFINPVLKTKGDETFEVWDDCMCFPNLLVKVKRYKNSSIRYKDNDWNESTMMLEGSLSELLQHEYDHLDGIIATLRAVDKFSFALKTQVKYL
ncbi:MAG: formylmethionine deformylase [Firmicutes bacterium HGW-Firmicutes-12]|jgi:peptide deformylase|nr:MAG: formylmethionine deformylase [Firmicutes bacterium HGW-Firmicutes-12]